ncbi:MAG: hypothetical protein HFI48_02135 [Lachnospiraceae bacterium]|nr:hypothetical protein [Lachnospiraceae bacterium]
MQDILYKEIDLIQACINRMAQNSLSCKSWCLTLIAGAFALVPENINKWYICVVMLCVDLCFWVLDSFYLLQERLYRDKYEWVIQKRLEGNRDFLYDLDPNNENMNLEDKKRNLMKVMISKSILPIYGGIAVLIVGFIVVRVI